jgi:hypothetical protein
MPIWVKAFIAVAVVLLLVVAAAALNGHSPWQHMAMMNH